MADALEKPYEVLLDGMLFGVNDDEWRRIHEENGNSPILRDLSEKPDSARVIALHAEKYGELAIGEVIDRLRNAIRAVKTTS